MADTTVCKNKEQQLRRALNKAGYSLRKSRKQISIDNLGDYMIVDVFTNCVVAGSRYNMTLDDVTNWMQE